MYSIWLVRFIVGAYVGSFINVLSMRMVDGRNWVTGRSECDSCKHALSFLDMIPLISYLIYKGKCRYCGTKIGCRHFLSELVCGVLFILAGFDIAALILFMVLWLNTLSDISSQVTITPTIYTGIFGIIFISLYKSKFGTEETIHAIIVIVLMCLIYAYNLWKTKENEDSKYLGLGDIDGFLILFAYGGAYFTVCSIAYGTLLYLLILMPLILSKKLDRKSRVPYIPALMIGSIIQVELGDIIWNILIAL